MRIHDHEKMQNNTKRYNVIEKMHQQDSKTATKDRDTQQAPKDTKKTNKHPKCPQKGNNKQKNDHN